ncbi:putative hydrolase, CocE/NonD family [Hoeflea sp. IMCC20628]|uniref:CocE/NonD family hydrolase n=1 Tax=Hoeflea sp. IMCC20628 TaxID=1620421 RepID=UPI00063ACEF3|nr:CocE/NonD family hydrolase [Hoeflea sp. IMCC20628]AKH98918.1 putative hydrolase, CocE/NonD family [Hoeflea sp. IMCC20628]
MRTVEETASLIFEKDVEIGMRDGISLRANIYRPLAPGQYPVVLAMGVYGKDVHFRDGFKPQWEKLTQIYPGIDKDGSTGRFLRWETADPERWVPDGYVLISVDSRGSGKSPGYLDPYSPTETMDHYEAIEWAGVQEWSNGKVGLLGISYFAIRQWLVASLQPPHLAAIVPWEGASDSLREWGRHGGIMSNAFPSAWLPRQVLVNQNGNENSPQRDPDTGERTTGPVVDENLLAGNIADHISDLRRHDLADEWHRERSADFSRINVPLFSAGNLGGPGLHLRGNIEGYMGAASSDKWLQLHVGTHYESFYLPEYVALQKRFFDKYLKGLDNGFEAEPPVRVAIRRADGATVHGETAWPLAGTVWSDHYLDASNKSLGPVAAAEAGSVEFEATGAGVTFKTAPFTTESEFTGPIVLKLFASSSTADMDIFATLRLFAADGTEVRFTGAHEEVPVTRGWLRASHRQLDPQRSTHWRPVLSHKKKQPIVPSEIYELDIEIWPTSIVCEKGQVLALTIMGNDFQYETPGRIVHNDPEDRGSDTFQGTTTIYSGSNYPSKIILPFIPANRQDRSKIG